MSTKRKPRPLPPIHPRSAKLIELFEDASEAYGLEVEAGFGSAVELARVAQAEAKAALYHHIRRLETKTK